MVEVELIEPMPAPSSGPTTTVAINILAIDPGDTTGFVLGKVLPDESITIVRYGTWTDLGSFIQPDIDSLFSHIDAIVMEDYRIYPHKARSHIGSRPYAIEVIGHVHLIAFRGGIAVTLQSASTAKGQWPDRRLHKHYSKTALRGLGVHPRDALRHLLTFVENKIIGHPIFSKQEAI